MFILKSKPDISVASNYSTPRYCLFIHQHDKLLGKTHISDCVMHPYLCMDTSRLNSWKYRWKVIERIYLIEPSVSMRKHTESMFFITWRWKKYDGIQIYIRIIQSGSETIFVLPIFIFIYQLVVERCTETFEYTIQSWIEIYFIHIKDISFQETALLAPVCNRIKLFRQIYPQLTWDNKRIMRT